MCGRFGFITPSAKAARVFHLEDWDEYEPRENISPGTLVPAIVLERGRRALRLRHWGLVPHWSKDRKIAFKLFNARAETAHEKPSFRDAFHRSRCLIPATCFYEWQKPEPGAAKARKTPWAFSLASAEPMTLAGLQAVWVDPASGERLLSCAILTCAPNELLARVHDRMPVILAEADRDAWLAPGTPPADLRALSRPYPAEEMLMERAYL